MSDIKLNTFGDIEIIDGKLSLVTGADAVAQHLRIRLRLFQGEWFLDQRIGIPFYRDVFIKNPNLSVVQSLFRRAISEAPGVEQVQQLDTEFFSTNRELRVTFTALLQGEEIPRNFSEAFIL